MKPVVIIAIAVGCSVVAVFGVLIAMQEIAFWQAEVAFEEYEKEQLAIEEAEKKKLRFKAEVDEWNSKNFCATTYSSKDGAYDYCVKYGYYEMQEMLLNYCATYAEGSGGHKGCMYDMAQMLGNQANPPTP